MIFREKDVQHKTGRLTLLWDTKQYNSKNTNDAKFRYLNDSHALKMLKLQLQIKVKFK